MSYLVVKSMILEKKMIGKKREKGEKHKESIIIESIKVVLLNAVDLDSCSKR